VRIVVEVLATIAATWGIAKLASSSASLGAPPVVVPAARPAAETQTVIELPVVGLPVIDLAVPAPAVVIEPMPPPIAPFPAAAE
jgi:hypothetical protein